MALTNQEIVDAYVSGERGYYQSRQKNLSIQDGKLYTYNSVLCQKHGPYWVVARDSYGMTSSMHRNKLLGAIHAYLSNWEWWNRPDPSVLMMRWYGPWTEEQIQENLADSVHQSSLRWNVEEADHFYHQLREWEAYSGMAEKDTPRIRIENLLNTRAGMISRLWYRWKTKYACHNADTGTWFLLPKDVGRGIRKNGLDVETVMRTRNAEIKRIGMEALGGWDAIINSPQCRFIHKDDWGVLYKIGVHTVVKVVNSTPEPDGTFKDYILEVHPELRPLPYQPRRQNRWAPAPDPYKDPQELTARNAVASTFGLRGEDYHPAYQT